MPHPSSTLRISLALAFALAGLAPACGGGAPQAATAGAPSARPSSSGDPRVGGPPFVIAPMTLVRDDGRTILEIRADGTVVVDGKPALRIVDNRIEFVEGGGTAATVRTDGSLYVDGKGSEARFGPGDDLEITTSTGETGTLVVADDGSIVGVRGGKTEKMPARFVGYQPSAKRIASILAWMAPEK